ncbi:uncharacterized protein UDID_18507 [Ustilago sp. UG-2017a]|nr:uncharacterized protein UDID_18507 [Ustilago sp. UG-2017a]
MTRLPIFSGGPGDVPVENLIRKFKRLLIFQNAHSSDTKATGYLSVRLEGGAHICLSADTIRQPEGWLKWLSKFQELASLVPYEHMSRHALVYQTWLLPLTISKL